MFKAETKVLILGAAGRDFHNFNCCFRDDESRRVVAFTATQIPGIEQRDFPASMAGPRYPEGIPTFPQEDLTKLIKEHEIDEAVFSFSDVPHEYVMHLASQVNAAGADFRLLGTEKTMLRAEVPVVAICATRTGCGKSQTTRYVARCLREQGKRVVAIRHPMPYGDLEQQIVQRFASYEDMEKHDCTIEEREEYEAHVDEGLVVYAGVDYAKILEQAQKEADVIIWDGGNNDTPFIRPDLWITVADPLRPGHEMAYHPGETNLRAADVIVINKVNAATAEDIQTIEANIAAANPNAIVIKADSQLTVEDSSLLAGKSVLIVEDGPTVTHGSMAFGAAYKAAEQYKVGSIVDPRPHAIGSICGVYEKYTQLGSVLPAMGYSAEQKDELERTINATPCDLVLYATPVDLTRLINVNKPALRVHYALADRGEPTVKQQIDQFVAKNGR